jgi:hypothetical protein
MWLGCPSCRCGLIKLCGSLNACERSSCWCGLVNVGWRTLLEPEAQSNACGSCPSLRSTKQRPNTGFQLTPLGGRKIVAILAAGISSTAFPIKRCGAAEA